MVTWSDKISTDRTISVSYVTNLEMVTACQRRGVACSRIPIASSSRMGAPDDENRRRPEQPAAAVPGACTGLRGRVRHHHRRRWCDLFLEPSGQRVVRLQFRRGDGRTARSADHSVRRTRRRARGDAEDRRRGRRTGDLGKRRHRASVRVAARRAGGSAHGRPRSAAGRRCASPPCCGAKPRTPR